MAKKQTTTERSKSYRFQYAVKFLCTANIPGTSQTTSSVLPGVYTTVINIHNPNDVTVRFRKKISLPGPGQVSNFIGAGLKPDESAKVDCEEITSKFGFTFIHGAEGFLVIESPRSLDVVAVYTAGQVGGGVESLAVEQIRERVIG